MLIDVPSASQLNNVENRVFTGRNLVVYALVWIAIFGSELFGDFRDLWPYASNVRPTGCADFGFMWVSGRLAVLHEVDRLFNYASFARAQNDLFGAGNCVAAWIFLYPPTLLFFTSPLGLFSFVTAFVVWNTVLTLLFLTVAYAILRRANAIIVAPLTRPAESAIYLGQDAFLTAGLFGLALTTLERSPVIAGLLFGSMTYKPQFGLLIPFALLASRNWRALASATVFSVALGLVATVAFGARGWSGFLSTVTSFNSALGPDPKHLLPVASVYGILRSAGFGSPMAWAAQGALVLFLVATVWIAWSKPIAYEIRASVLCVASLLATPYVVYYDLCLLTISAAFFISDGLRRGFVC